MFNDEPYGLTDAVMSGVKRQTRRIVPDTHLKAYEQYRAEKLQSISDEDIAAEGVRAITPGWECTACPKKESAKQPARNLRGAYNRLIDGVSKKQVFRKNPMCSSLSLLTDVFRCIVYMIIRS